MDLEYESEDSPRLGTSTPPPWSSSSTSEPPMTPVMSFSSLASSASSSSSSPRSSSLVVAPRQLGMLKKRRKRKTLEIEEGGESAPPRPRVRKRLSLNEMMPAEESRDATVWGQRNGGCHICGKKDHWQYKCPLRGQFSMEETQKISLDFKAKYNSVCHLCGADVKAEQDKVVPISSPDGNDVWPHRDCYKSMLVEKYTELAVALEEIKDTDETVAILARVKSGKSTLIQAGAGAGKTQILYRIHQELRNPRELCMYPPQVLVLAYNKAAGQELYHRGVGPDARTFHSFGWKVLNMKMKAPGPSLDSKKTKKLLERFCEDDFRQEEARRSKPRRKAPLYKFDRKTRLTSRMVEKLVSLAKAFGLGIPEMAELNDAELCKICERFSVVYIPKENEDEFARAFNSDPELVALHVRTAARWVLKQGSKPSETMMDFDDQLYMPLKLRETDERYGGFDWILVDEAQDSNPIRRELVRVSLKADSGRVVVVGDSRQAIYAYAGADSESLLKFEETFSTGRPLSLSVTWRCPKRHVQLVNKFLDKHAEILRPGSDDDDDNDDDDDDDGDDDGHLRAAPGAAEGMVQEQCDFLQYPVTEQPDAAILSRRTAPLVRLFYAFLRRGQEVRVLGRKEIGSGMKKELEEAMSGRTYESLEEVKVALEARKRELERKESDSLHDDEGEDAGDGGKEGNPKSRDLIDCVVALIDHLSNETSLEGPQEKSLDDLKSLIQRFSDVDRSDGRIGKGKVVTLSTVHKSKGLEYARVYILQPKDLPLSRVMMYGEHWEQVQELNVTYVAFTRSTSDLIFLRDVDEKMSSNGFDDLWSTPAPSESDPEEESGSEDDQSDSADPADKTDEDEDEEELSNIKNAAGFFKLKFPDLNDREEIVCFSRAAKREYYRRIREEHPDKTRSDSTAEAAAVINDHKDAIDGWVNFMLA